MKIQQIKIYKVKNYEKLFNVNFITSYTNLNLEVT